jgi:hypothetical protein
VSTFPIRRSPWATLFLVPRRPAASLEGGMLVVRMGALGRADIPIDRIASVGTMRWPWWGGLGARIARSLVAFVGASGPAAVLELTEPTEVRAPLKWSATRVAVGAEDVEGFVAAVARARGVGPEEEEAGGP